ncbi:hook-length control protein FliK [Dendrosporobacter quercicolus]|uniref:Hook-length control protein FliK n=1 Tax=Dendrosporobacter quercicolus TaxID=146817 RepID=A0A1G9ML81_9FIRM|nr:flagellar hook-length control protein FliK [Dendrosporobacter quercicolus]SDL74415.1 hook-length control protein FliK [Dendrosporobacter quercicolus]
MNAIMSDVIMNSAAAGGRGQESAKTAAGCQKGQTFSDAMAAATTDDEQDIPDGKGQKDIMLPFTMPAMVTIEPAVIPADPGAAAEAGAETEFPNVVAALPAQPEDMPASQQTGLKNQAPIPLTQAEAAVPELQADSGMTKSTGSAVIVTNAGRQGTAKAEAAPVNPLQEMLSADGNEDPVTSVNTAGQMLRKDQKDQNTAPVQVKSAASLPGNVNTQPTAAVEADAEQPELTAVPGAVNKAAATTTGKSTEPVNVKPENKANLTSTDGETGEAEPVKNVFAELLQQRTTQTHPTEAKGAATQFVKDTHNITTQIVEQAQLLKNNQETQMIIKLKPEHLGELTLKVTVDKGIVNASFHSDHAEVRTVLEASLQQLKQELSNQGLKVDTVGVYAGLGQFLSNGQREAPQQPIMKFKNKLAGEDAFEEAEAVLSNQAVSDDGVDYRV